MSAPRQAVLAPRRQAGPILSAPGCGGGRVGHDREAGAVVRIVLDRRRHDMKTVLARRVEAGHAPSEASSWRGARFGIAGNGRRSIPGAFRSQALHWRGLAGAQIAVRPSRRFRGAAGCGGPQAGLARITSGPVKTYRATRDHASVEFSTGTTPNLRRRRSSRGTTFVDARQGTRTIDEPRADRGSSLNVPDARGRRPASAFRARDTPK